MKDETKKISKNREKKVGVVAELTEKAARAKAIVFTGYQGMTHIQLEQLKKGLKSLNAELVVAKNSLLKLMLEKNATKETNGSKETKEELTSVPSVSSVPFFPSLEGATATLFAYDDVVGPIKEIAKIIKSIKMPTIKFGILEGKVLAEADVMRLSTLPTRDVLIAKVVGGMKSPLYGLHRALNWNIQKLVLTLNAIQQKKV